MYLSIEFQEEYKRLDRLCKDYLASAEGVSEYIRQMESTSIHDRCYVCSWENDYKQLKHVRWIRNQFAHEVGTLNSNICTEADLIWVINFHNRIIDGNDPFTIIRKAQSAETIEKQQNHKKQLYNFSCEESSKYFENFSEDDFYTENPNPLKIKPIKKTFDKKVKKVSLLKRIIVYIRDLFY